MTAVPRTTLLFVLAALASLALPMHAGAHAILEQTSPARGVTVDRAPGLISFGFSERVEGSFGAVRVFDGRGERVDAGELIRTEGDESVGVRLAADLPDGTYTATYRVISADAHPVAGGFVFSIGAAGIPGKTVSELTAESDAGTVTDTAFGIARGVTYAAIALAIGGLVFLLAVWLPSLRGAAGHEQEWLSASQAFARRSHGLMIAALFIGMLSEVLQIVLQGATAAGISFWSALDPDVIEEVLQTRFGTVHVIAAAVFACALVLFGARRWVHALRPATVGAAGLAPPRSIGRLELGVVGLLLGYLALSPALSGHASTQSPSGLLVPLDVLHVTAMSIWVGGLVTLAVAVPAATRALSAPDRTRLLAGVLARFSPLALASVCVLLGTGLVQSYVHVRSLDNLIDTGFGRAVLIKFCLLVVLIALGAYNRNRALPRLREIASKGASPGAAGIGLRRALRTEIGLLAVVLGVTAALVSYAPAVTSGSGLFAETKRVGPLELQVTVDPAKVGRNEMHLYLFRARDGSQFTATKELRIRMRLPSKDIGPLSAHATRAGPGHYVVPAVDFGVKGDWEVRFIGRVSEFDQYETTVEVPIG